MLVSETRYTKISYDDNGGRDLIVSFSHMDFDSSSDRFWGDAVFRTLGYDGLGIVCKGNHWFPKTDLLAHETVLKEIVARYRNRILYGFSMGGYGALKFSSMLNATTVLALSPQWSIDPADVYQYDRRLCHLYRPEVNGAMAIAPGDVSGKAYAFFDPHDKRDVWNVDQINKAAPDLKRIKVFGVGHETIDVLAGTENLRSVLEACASQSEAEAQRLIAKLRRAQPRRILAIAEAATVRHPHWAKAILERKRDCLGPQWKARWLTSYDAAMERCAS